MAAPRAPFLRFHDALDKRPDGCWLWTGSAMSSGYGQLKVFGEMVAVHRYAYELYKGPIAAGMHILHSCDVKMCVNPDHLRVGSHAENMGEAADRGLMRSGADHPMFGRRNPRPNQSNKVRVLGREYCSQKEAEQALGLGSGTVRYWIKNKPERAQLLVKDS